MIDPKALEMHGVRISYDENWVGEPGVDRHSVPDHTRVRCVFLALTAAEWCDLAMREGNSYIGGCCGTSSKIQDEVNGIFRESGFADADSLFTIGEMAQSHPDGFKEWGFLGTMSQKTFDKRCNQWDKLAPWEKIGLSYQAVKDKIRAFKHNSEPIVLENRPDLDAKREIDELYGCIHMLHFASFFDRIEKATPDGDEKNGQRHANDVRSLAKMLPATRRLLSQLEANFTSWTGVAIVEKARPEVITHNGYGLCIYNTLEDAEEVVALWRKNDKAEPKRDSLADRVAIRPLTISVQKGVEFLG